MCSGTGEPVTPGEGGGRLGADTCVQAGTNSPPTNSKLNAKATFQTQEAEKKLKGK